MSSPDSTRCVACDAGSPLRISPSRVRDASARRPQDLRARQPARAAVCGEMRSTVEGERKLDVAIMKPAMVEIITRFHQQNRVALDVGHQLPVVPATV